MIFKWLKSPAMKIPHPGKRLSMSVNDLDKYSNISLSLAQWGGILAVAATIHGNPLVSLGVSFAPRKLQG